MMAWIQSAFSCGELALSKYFFIFLSTRVSSKVVGFSNAAKREREREIKVRLRSSARSKTREHTSFRTLRVHNVRRNRQGKIELVLELILLFLLV